MSDLCESLGFSFLTCQLILSEGLEMHQIGAKFVTGLLLMEDLKKIEFIYAQSFKPVVKLT